MKITYEKPDIAICLFDGNQFVTLSGFQLIDEGFGDIVLWD